MDIEPVSKHSIKQEQYNYYLNNGMSQEELFMKQI